MKALRGWWERRNAKLAQRELQREALEPDANQGAPLGDAPVAHTAGQLFDEAGGAAGLTGNPLPAAENEPGRYRGD
jgi:hypothetical protein